MFEAVKALKIVDLPTFGNPTIPHWSDMVKNYIRKDLALDLCHSPILKIQTIQLGDLWQSILLYL